MMASRTWGECDCGQKHGEWRAVCLMLLVQAIDISAAQNPNHKQESQSEESRPY